MARPRRATCRVCGLTVAEVGPLSARGKCAGCGNERHLANTAQLRAHSGPAFDHWRRRSAAAVGAILLDDAA